MYWVSALWAMVASTYFTLSFIHLMIWFRFRARWHHFLFSIATFSAGSTAVFELVLMHATTVESYGEIMRWAFVPIFFMVGSLIAFTAIYFRPKRVWIGVIAATLRIIATIINFFCVVNLAYISIDSLVPITTWGGEIIVAARGVRNPLISVGELSSLFVMIFVADISVTVWRRGERRRALMVGGTLVLFLLIGAGSSALVHAGIVQLPYCISFSLLPFILAMGYELSLDLFREAQLVEKVRASEVDLRESERRLELAATAAELALWVWEVEKDEIWMTPGGRAFFGFGSGEKLTLERFVAAVHPEFQARVRQGVVGATLDGGDYESEFQIHLPGQAPRWISGRGRVEFNERGGAVRMRGVSIDITRRKETERELHRQREELIHLSRVSTLGELSGSLAHELNQPLTSILSNSQAGQRFLDHERVNLVELRDILSDIADQGKRAGEVIQRIRLLLKKGEVNFVALDMSEVIQEVLKLMRSDLISHGVIIKTNFTSDLPPIRGDRVQLQQVLLNLVMNACDAISGTDGKYLTVSTAVRPRAGVVVSVADRGRGISPDKLEQIFEPFVTTKDHGMGLGLSLCRTIIHAHGGNIWAENALDGGAILYFSLPLEQGHPDPSSRLEAGMR